MDAGTICRTAATLVSGDRARTHGDKRTNHENIARLWNAYLRGRPLGERLTGRDVALMMALLKVARTLTGAHNADDYVDAVGYAAIAGELAETEPPRDAAVIPMQQIGV